MKLSSTSCAAVDGTPNMEVHLEAIKQLAKGQGQSSSNFSFPKDFWSDLYLHAPLLKQFYGVV